MQGTSVLDRRLGTFDAVVIGLGSMLGAGVFVVFSPAAAVAGGSLLISLGIAGVVAYCNAAASAQLAQRYPASGGTYVYGRERLGPWAGFIAGWGFVTGKAASGAAMAFTVGLYAAPQHSTAAAVAAVVLLTTVNLLGVTRTALVTRVLLVIVLSVLSVALVLMFTGPAAAATGPGWQVISGSGASGSGASPLNVLQGAGLLFFAFAGYARIATLGEEVKDPGRAIPRAVLGALALALAIYLLVGAGLLRALGPVGTAESRAPLVAAVEPWAHWAAPVVVIGAVSAGLGALLGLIAGIGRTALAMAREGDLPGPLARVGTRFRVPYLADLAVAAVIITLLLATDILTVVGFSSFGVLIYYSVTNLAALTLPDRPWHAPRALNVLGLVGCLVLAFTLPPASIAVMLGVLAAGVAGRAALLVRRRRRLS